MVEALRDAHGREITDLRVSVTDRCNFRCRYCMPAEGMRWLDREQLLSFEEITRLVSVLAGLGVTDVRLTGGEPLARREFPRLVSMLRPIEGIRDLSVTTNGYLLERDAAALVDAGIDRITSRSTRSPATASTRSRGVTPCRRSSAGSRRSPRTSACGRSRSTRSRCATSPRARRSRSPSSPARPIRVRFIEFMPLDGDRAWTPDRSSPARSSGR